MKTTETERAKNIGTLLKNLPQKHAREYTQGLTLDENTMLQKLVSEEILTAKIKMQHSDGKTRPHTGIRVESKDYLKASIFVDYYSTVLDETISVCEGLITLAIKVRELSQAKDRTILDLNLETVVIETGLVAQQRSSESPESGQLGNITQRYDQSNTFVAENPSRKIEPYYQAIGLRIVEMVSPERRCYLDDVNSRSDLGAVIFTECVLGVLQDQETIDLIEKGLAENKLKASVSALYALRNEASVERLGDAIRRNYND